MNEKLEKLLDRCNEMDITERLNWLGDASMPYQAKLEYAKLHVELQRLQRIEQAANKALESLRSTARNWDEQCLFDANDILAAALKAGTE